MSTKDEIADYINSQPAPKQEDLCVLHQLILKLKPRLKLWFLDGRNSENKVVSNPNIGYGVRTIQYADGKSKEFYRVGLSANTSGISVYILGIEDKKFLDKTYGNQMGKATITGYCIKFKAIKDINIETLKSAILYGLELKN
jgi:hypothetical protein